MSKIKLKFWAWFSNRFLDTRLIKDSCCLHFIIKFIRLGLIGSQWNQRKNNYGTILLQQLHMNHGCWRFYVFWLVSGANFDTPFSGIDNSLWRCDTLMDFEFMLRFIGASTQSRQAKRGRLFQLWGQSTLFFKIKCALPIEMANVFSNICKELKTKVFDGFHGNEGGCIGDIGKFCDRFA